MTTLGILIILFTYGCVPLFSAEESTLPPAKSQQGSSSPEKGAPSKEQTPEEQKKKISKKKRYDKDQPDRGRPRGIRHPDYVGTNGTS